MGRVSASAITVAKSDPHCMTQHCKCHPPAMGHRWQAGTLVCACGCGWFSHQRDPSPCPSAVRQAVSDQEKPFAKARGI